MEFRLVSDYQPAGDQPAAIEGLVRNIRDGVRDQVLLGVTGSGKTFTMANVIARLGRPALVLAHNKTLAAQLFGEFKQLFPDNAVEYFVSYYDYYQPEAYIPRSDTYIEKDSSINDRIDRLRHSATRSLLERRDVIIVASVSCIYGLGSPEHYRRMLLIVEKGTEYPREAILAQLVAMQYARNDVDFHRGTFRVRGDVVEVLPAYENELGVRIELFGDQIEALSTIDPLTGKKVGTMERTVVFPASHYVMPADRLELALQSIDAELDARSAWFRGEGRLLEEQRLTQRTRFDMEMLQELGYCTGIENYSRHLDGRRPGDPPATLISFFPDDYLVFIDESHQSVPQVAAMFNGDRSRKQTLVDYGFRLPSALDNRPLTFAEFEERLGQTVYVSATPGPYELKKSGGLVVEQVIRPTGLVDPAITIRPATDQVDDLVERVRDRVGRGHRVLVTTLTKRMAEDLTEFLRDLGVRVRYLHSEINTIERVEIVRDLRLGTFDVLVGVNLLREGLDLPEVSLVAILDADKEGFLRSDRSLIQTVGRAARHVEGEVIFYADKVTDSMRRAIDETTRRRDRQLAYNREHGITSQSIVKEIGNVLASIYERDYFTVPVKDEAASDVPSPIEIPRRIEHLKRLMKEAAKKLDFERAAELRDRVRELEDRYLALGEE
jgi:excinuclease ABC subunit B